MRRRANPDAYRESETNADLRFDRIWITDMLRHSASGEARYRRNIRREEKGLLMETNAPEFESDRKPLEQAGNSEQLGDFMHMGKGRNGAALRTPKDAQCKFIESDWAIAYALGSWSCYTRPPR